MEDQTTHPDTSIVSMTGDPDSEFDEERITAKEDEEEAYDEADLICPISQERMQDPVSLVETGSSYDCQSICQSLLVHPNLDPITGLRFTEKKLSFQPNLVLREQLIQTHGESAYVPYNDSEFQEQYDLKWMEFKNPPRQGTPTRRRQQPTQRQPQGNTDNTDSNNNNNNNDNSNSNSNNNNKSKVGLIVGLTSVVIVALALIITAMGRNSGDETCTPNILTLSTQYRPSSPGVSIWPVNHYFFFDDQTSPLSRVRVHSNYKHRWGNGWRTPFWEPGKDHFLNITHCADSPSCTNLAGSVSLQFCMDDGTLATLLNIENVQDFEQKVFEFTIPFPDGTTLEPSVSVAPSASYAPSIAPTLEPCPGKLEFASNVSLSGFYEDFWPVDYIFYNASTERAEYRVRFHSKGIYNGADRWPSGEYLMRLHCPRLPGGLCVERSGSFSIRYCFQGQRSVLLHILLLLEDAQADIENAPNLLQIFNFTLPSEP